MLEAITVKLQKSPNISQKMDNVKHNKDIIKGSDELKLGINDKYTDLCLHPYKTA
jgi:hypothetical protein